MTNVINEHWQHTVAAMRADPWLFTGAWIVHLSAIYFGIRRGAEELPLARSHYFVFIVAFNVVVFFVVWIASLVDSLAKLAGINVADILVIGLVGFVNFMIARYSARRLREIGWSPFWAWLLVVYIVGYLFMLALCFVPPNKNVAKRFIGHKVA